VKIQYIFINHINVLKQQHFVVFKKCDWKQ